MSFIQLPIVLRTIAYLKIIQIVYQVLYRSRAVLPDRWRHARITLPESLTQNTLSLRAPFMQRPFIQEKDVENNQFDFLNQSVAYNATIDWRVMDRSRLWRYNLHYFNYLFPDRPLNWHTGRGLIMDWIAANPAGTLDAWDPFPTSLRIVNWIKFISSNTQPNSALPKQVFQSLYHQTLFLERSIEYHLLANHLFKNIKALLFAGLILNGPDAQRWRMIGCRLLGKQIDEQVLNDGGHFERSPMYHAMILEDVLDLLNILPEAETASLHCDQNYWTPPKG